MPAGEIEAAIGYLQAALGERWQNGGGAWPSSLTGARSSPPFLGR